MFAASIVDRNGPIMDENPSPKARGRSYAKGTSGNPAGRPKGARNRSTIAVEALLDGQAEAITQKAIGLALQGDRVALRLCLERILPAQRERRINCAIPPLESAEDAASAIVAAVASGDLTLSEAAQLGKLVDSFVKAIEARDRDKHLKLLEWQHSNWNAKFEAPEPKDDTPEELPLWTPRIGAIRTQWKMPLREYFRVMYGPCSAPALSNYKPIGNA